MPSIVGYWNIRGLAQPIRLILEYCEEDYEDRRYVIGPPPEYDRSAWHDDARTFGLDFPNIPYYVDGNIKITQSLAIIAHLGEKYGLAPTTEMEKIRTNMAMHQQNDLRGAHCGLTYDKDFNNLREGYIRNTLIPNLKNFTKFLGPDSWVCGEKLTFVDFILYENLEHHRIFAPTIFEQFDVIMKYLKRFEELPRIQDYMNSDRFIENPIYRSYAVWGNN